MDLELYQTAFLNGDLDEEIYMDRVALMDRSPKYASSKDKSMGASRPLDFIEPRWVYDDGGGLLCLCEKYDPYGNHSYAQVVFHIFKEIGLLFC